MARKVKAGALVEGEREGISEAAVARSLAARRIVGISEVTKARPLVARVGKPEAAVAISLAASKIMDIPEATNGEPLISRGRGGGPATAMRRLSAEDSEKQE